MKNIEMKRENKGERRDSLTGNGINPVKIAVPRDISGEFFSYEISILISPTKGILFLVKYARFIMSVYTGSCF